MVRFLLRTLIHRSTWRVGRGRFLSSSTVSSHNPSPKEPLIASNDSSSSFGLKTLRGSAVKLGFAALTSAFVGAVGYTSYAYTSDELEKKAAKFKLAANQTAVDADVSGFDKIQSLAYSTAAKVPVKAIEIYIDIRKSIEEHIKGFTEPSSDSLLPDLHPQEQHVFTLVLDLNETLVYSDWKRERGWRTFKRPGVEAFLEHLAQFYEIVVYSDQLSMYVDPVIERLDQKGCIRYRLSRAATKYVNGKHYRDLSKLNRDPARILYLSGHALESTLQPENSVPIAPWKLEPEDTVLLDLIPFLEYVARSRPADIRHVLASYGGRNIATEFIERSKEYQRKTQMQKRERRLLWR